MRRLFFFLVGSFLFVPSVVQGHGVVGQRLFVEPFATPDAHPNSEAGVEASGLKRFDEKEWELETDLTLQLSENWALEIGGAWLRVEHGEGRETGFGNPEVTAKYVMHRSAPHEWLASFALTYLPSVGDEDVGAEPDDAIAPGLRFSKGFPHFPEGLRYLRPLMIQGDLSVQIPLSKTDHAEDLQSVVAYDLFVAYSIPYLQQSIRDLGLRWPFNRFFVGSDFNFETILNGPEAGETEALARPGLIWVGRWMQWGLAATIPLNDHSGSRVGFLGQAVAYFDDLFPKTFNQGLLDRQ